jgi:PilZ domain-containing protein
MAIPTSGRSSILKRRSARLPLNSAVAVSGEDRSKCSFTISAKATNLNKHGGAIQITRELLVGTTVLVRNKRGTQISARVVSQINAEQGLLRYGIEFVEEDTRAASFWGITFPSNA